MPAINTSDIIRASDSIYYIDIVRIKKFILTYIQNKNSTQSNMNGHDGLFQYNLSVFILTLRKYSTRFLTEDYYNKVKGLWYTGQILDWIEDFLTIRRQSQDRLFKQ